MYQQQEVKTPQDVGIWGEELAVRVLDAQGYAVVERNWRPGGTECTRGIRGEIDIVALDPLGELVFVEVKTRSSRAAGHPFEAVGQSKSQKLRQLAYAWCSQRQEPCPKMRIDVVAILGNEERFTFEHLKAVV